MVCQILLLYSNKVNVQIETFRENIISAIEQKNCSVYLGWIIETTSKTQRISLASFGSRLMNSANLRLPSDRKDVSLVLSHLSVKVIFNAWVDGMGFHIVQIFYSLFAYQKKLWKITQGIIILSLANCVHVIGIFCAQKNALRHEIVATFVNGLIYRQWLNGWAYFIKKVQFVKVLPQYKIKPS